MPIEGPLRELGIHDLLQMIDLARKTGILTVRSQRMKDDAVVHVLDGELVFASRRRSMRLLGQQLLREGKLTEADLDRALEQQRADPRQRLGAILVELGSVEPDELDRQLRLQIEETIFDLLSWDEGYFRFEELEETPDSPVRVRVDSLLMEAARRLDEWTRLGARLPNGDAVPVLATGRRNGTQGRLDLRPEEWEVLVEIDGERDLRHIASNLGRSAFDVAKIVHGLTGMQVVSLRDQPAASPEAGLGAVLDELELLLADGKLERAERRARELQKAHPDRAEFHLIAGRALAAQSRLRAAVEAFDRAVGLDPLSFDAHYHLGLVAARIGDLDGAADAWRSFLRLAPVGDRRTYVEQAMVAISELQHFLRSAPAE
jgi:tetratricopeptide (TPR) repeat protein